MKPRHAELLASDLDTETLYRYVDRFLMFYVRTADRLQRTSVWRDNLEGGLDYLKEVVIDDSLGLGAELEAEMARVIGSYQDEWNTAINDPETLKRFRSEEHTSELQSLMRISYAVLCLKKKSTTRSTRTSNTRYHTTP